MKWIKNKIASIILWTCDRYCPYGQMCLMYEVDECPRYRLLVNTLGIDLDGGE